MTSFTSPERVVPLLRIRRVRPLAAVGSGLAAAGLDRKVHLFGGGERLGKVKESAARRVGVEGSAAMLGEVEGSQKNGARRRRAEEDGGDGEPEEREKGSE
jgi:hypothetical protein